MVALFSRINPGRDWRDREHDEFVRLLRAFNERHPNDAQKALLSANEKRRLLQRYEVEKPAWMAYGEVPILRIPPLWKQAVERFARKLALALHYKHTGKIVPKGAWILTDSWTNFHRASGHFPAEIWDQLPTSAQLKRGNVSLNDQFHYSYGISDDGTLGAYFSTFRISFAVIGLIAFDPTQMAGYEDDAALAIRKVANE